MQARSGAVVFVTHFPSAAVRFGLHRSCFLQLFEIQASPSRRQACGLCFVAFVFLVVCPVLRLYTSCTGLFRKCTGIALISFASMQARFWGISNVVLQSCSLCLCLHS